MFNLSELYHPITANPAGGGEYRPGRLLHPYIRCFWGSVSPTAEPLDAQSVGITEGNNGADISETESESKSVFSNRPETIIPDSCMDIIWEWDERTGESGGIFCGINDAPFEVGQARQPAGKQRFAIRFHFWAVHLFADEQLQDVLNVHAPVEQYFRSYRMELGDKLRGTHTMSERIAIAEVFLLRRLDYAGRSSDGMMNAVHRMLKSRGVVSAGELELSSGLSSRQLERLFRRHIGLPPKKVADLVRFQNAWLELYRTPLHRGGLQDIVFAYGYSHQSHFINNFRKFAGRTPLDALSYARS
ncbi:helix-turn-helix domain-containing protein [Paenibacillus sp. FSL R7-0297]|uniref:helix-turn-helix domain-containing protein n=1 Tax=Paenibacillus sp. FSL R7-0297 TaxID=2921680 RepID=UPI0030F6D39D